MDCVEEQRRLEWLQLRWKWQNGAPHAGDRLEGVLGWCLVSEIVVVHLARFRATDEYGGDPPGILDTMLQGPGEPGEPKCPEKEWPRGLPRQATLQHWHSD